MSRTIPNSRPCAAPSCGRIELAPSWRMAAFLAAWLAAFCGVVLSEVALALPARIGICAAAILAGVSDIRSTFLFADRRAIRALRWDEGHLFVVPGRCGIEVCVTL